MEILKKIILLCSFLCGIVFVSSAMAHNCVAYSRAGGVDKSRIYLYFGENKDTAPASGECDASNGSFDDVKTYLRGIWDAGNVAGFYVIGAASRTGTAEYNSGLSKRRIDYVTDNILPSGRITWWAAGESDATVMGDSDGVTSEVRRYACILVIWKQHTCTEATVGLLEKIRKFGGDVEECKEVKEYCKDGTDSKDILFEDKLNKLHKCASVLNIEVDVDFDLWYKADTAYNNLTALLSGLSVWKNAEGKFNTSRLLSDSVAAVVLGTTSGVITSTLVKKNQIKKGFESLRCMVGGQPVADYGDEFVVGATATAYSR